MCEPTSPYEYPLTPYPEPLPVVFGAQCGGTIINFGPTSPGWDRTACAPNPQWHAAGVTILPGGTIPRATPEVRLSDADVERIAKRVAELLRAGG